MTGKAKAKKAFKLHWGSGVVAEEAQCETEYTVPTIQLLDFDEGFAEGRKQIRFCHYSPKGAFLRSPLIIDVADIPALKSAIKGCPELHGLLKKLV